MVSYFHGGMPFSNKLLLDDIRSVAINDGVIETLVNHLKNQRTCLFAAYALSHTLGHGQFFNRYQYIS